jgi:uncharacterized protein YndB with AHSA1/START domain
MSGAARGPDAPLGELDERGDYATLVFRRFLSHPPEKVWKAITDPAALRQWFLTEAKVDGRPGGTVDLVTTSAQVRGTGRILTWSPPNLYEHEWNVAPTSSLPDGENAIVRWELSRVPGGTSLCLTYRNLRVRTARVFRGGMLSFLGRLTAWLDGAPLPDWAAGIVRPPPPDRGPG